MVAMYIFQRYFFILFNIMIELVFGYINKQFTLKKAASDDFECNGHITTPKQDIENFQQKQFYNFESGNFSFPTIKIPVVKLKDPLTELEKDIDEVLYGRKTGEHRVNKQPPNDDIDLLAHMPSGQVMRGEIFHNKSAVHLPFAEYMHRDHIYLKISRDYMQTAVDAFTIFLTGTLNDILRLVPDYVLESTRTISMMRIAREKLVATWYVVKGDTPTHEISYETLMKYRPLFKYINGKEMSRLNLSDDRILSYIGTHPEINRHQVGVVASRYLEVNTKWRQAKYLNIMNNLICGIPVIIMRQIPKFTFLQLTHQLFHHIQACEPVQRKFYLQMMMRTQVLGKSYSWSARDVFRLGLLLSELDGESLSAINPEAMAGITSKVMLEMSTKTLRYITETQMRYIGPKALNIMTRKLITFQRQTDINSGNMMAVYIWTLLLNSVTLTNKIWQ